MIGGRRIDSPGAPGDQFGRSVSIDGDFAIAGAPYHDGGEGLTDCGHARIFESALGNTPDAWVSDPARSLRPSDGAASDEFGVSVSISGDCAVVGTLKYMNGRGAVYVFRKYGVPWPELVKLGASDGSPWGFGSAVSISGNYAIVGDKFDLNSAGSAYLYDISGGPTPPAIKFLPAVPLLLLD
jgi:hypothetical protein